MTTTLRCDVGRHINIIQKLVIDVAVVTSSRHTERSMHAIPFGYAYTFSSIHFTLLQQGFSV